MRHRYSWPRARFEPVIPASERRQTQALDRAANGIVVVVGPVAFIFATMALLTLDLPL